ncbi:MAG: phytoene/squalene synthase family protein [Pseudomonadota bacterium]
MSVSDRDLEACREAIRHGSKSFYAASHLLPRQVCDDALALYAFCRLADDAVDLHDEKVAAVLRLMARLDAVYAGRPEDNPADRAFARMVERKDMPRALPDALIEGLAWDAKEREYTDLSGVRAYSARVASAVGVMMTVLMGVRDRQALARACDLGVAMQLTNIARDVGEDARMGRIYLPLDWLAEEGVEAAALRHTPQHSPGLSRVVARLLAEARRLYLRSEAGIAQLPFRCRPAIFASRSIYAAIGQEVARNRHDSITVRAHTSTGRKLGLLTTSLMRSALTPLTPTDPTLHAPALPEVQFLVDAAAQDRPSPASNGERFISLMAELEAIERRRRATRRAGQTRPGPTIAV